MLKIKYLQCIFDCVVSIFLGQITWLYTFKQLFTFYFSFFTYIYMLLCCYFYIIFILLYCPLSGPDLIYISLLIIPCIIYYVTNKETLNLELKCCLKLVTRLVTASEIMHFPLKIKLVKSMSICQLLTVHLYAFILSYIFFPQAKAFCWLHSFFVWHRIDPQIWYFETGHCVTHEWIHNLIMRFSY